MEDRGSSAGDGGDDPAPVSLGGAACAFFIVAELNEFSRCLVVVDKADAVLFEGLDDGLIEDEESVVFPERVVPTGV